MTHQRVCCCPDEPPPEECFYVGVHCPCETGSPLPDVAILCSELEAEPDWPDEIVFKVNPLPGLGVVRCYFVSGASEQVTDPGSRKVVSLPTERFPYCSTCCGNVTPCSCTVFEELQEFCPSSLSVEISGLGYDESEWGAGCTIPCVGQSWSGVMNLTDNRVLPTPFCGTVQPTGIIYCAAGLPTELGGCLNLNYLYAKCFGGTWGVHYGFSSSEVGCGVLVGTFGGGQGWNDDLFPCCIKSGHSWVYDTGTLVTVTIT